MWLIYTLSFDACVCVGNGERLSIMMPDYLLSCFAIDDAFSTPRASTKLSILMCSMSHNNKTCFACFKIRKECH